MGGGNAQKSAKARQMKQEKMKTASKGSQLADNAKAMNIQCKVCLQTFVSTTASVKLKEHADNKHPKNPYEQCFPNNPL
ncbi:uncharacterized protein MICPUCDRAFT_35623 [Micromonas pusilla CCMP1545]|uniref:Predicted protein n=1 Tax=Micromonas pusilla (strain CCMP1545) TaxID=564608 RepID=C1N1U6_MICPC|nr:uncharacterized protein MICPUCDRAFT_35623 [Micromonas pusilla CCMP1545]EEH53687.1 predicted protein [Micromonas pusilla CCMP1545]|eukprot:XP_003061975.1 predicted protein [Micromonas pusilla CCMP1545]